MRAFLGTAIAVLLAASGAQAVTLQATVKGFAVIEIAEGVENDAFVFRPGTEVGGGPPIELVFTYDPATMLRTTFRNAAGDVVEDQLETGLRAPQGVHSVRITTRTFEGERSLEIDGNTSFNVLSVFDSFSLSASNSTRTGEGTLAVGVGVALPLPVGLPVDVTAPFAEVSDFRNNGSLSFSTRDANGNITSRLVATLQMETMTLEVLPPAVIPLPAGGLLLASAGAALFLLRRRKPA